MALSRILKFLCIVLFFTTGSCTHEPISPPFQIPVVDTGVSYARDITPILSSHCSLYSCHSSHNVSNFPLETYKDVMNYAGVVVFKPLESNIYQVIDRNYMPQLDTLSVENKHRIYDWIQRGALNN